MIARRLASLLLVGLMGFALGCSTKPIVHNPPPDEPVFPAERVIPEGAPEAFVVDDPLEGFNRTMYRFNYHADKWVLLPAVRTYRFLLPQFVRTGVHNFFNNFFNIRTFVNQLLQGRPVRAVATSGRFALNTTLGVFGLVDVATHAGMPYYKEDFGQTLGVWGVGPGAFLVLPLYGPSTVRDAVGLGVDGVIQSQLDPLDFDDHPDRQYVYYPLMIIDTRDSVAFRYYSTGSPFEYELVRRMILTLREIEVAK